MATSDGSRNVVPARWRDRDGASLLNFLLALPVGFALWLVAMLVSLGSNVGLNEQHLSLRAAALVVLVLLLAGLLPAHGVWLASHSLRRRASMLGWLGLVLNAMLLVFFAVWATSQAVVLFRATSAQM
jgi:uncharacterized membrane protein